MQLLIQPYFISEAIPDPIFDPWFPVAQLIALQQIFTGHKRLHLISAFRQDFIEPIIKMYAEFIRHCKVRGGIEYVFGFKVSFKKHIIRDVDIACGNRTEKPCVTLI